MATTQINYIEIPVNNLERTKAFFTDVFNWSFVDYGEHYAAFQYAGIDGGFYSSESTGFTSQNAPLVVLYSDKLTEMKAIVEEHGGKIVKDTFEFPGGCRFHFTDPSNNEFAVWSEQP